MAQEDKRQHVRKELAMHANFRTVENVPVTVTVSDISESGCRIECTELSLQDGKRVLLRPDGFESFLGTVCWVTGHDAGIKFDQQLHPAVVDHLCRMHADGSSQIALDLAA